MLPLLLFIFIVVPIAELAVIIQVGEAIGVWWTIAILVADSVLGSVLMRTQGRAAWRRFNEALADGRIPAREVIDGVLVVFGGAFLLTPGFITDIFGAVFLIPPTRAIVRRLLVRRFGDRMIATARTRAGMTSWPPPRNGGPRPGDVDGTAVDLDGERLPRGTG
jgi:UPF0716 protein FxsA